MQIDTRLQPSQLQKWVQRFVFLLTVGLCIVSDLPHIIIAIILISIIFYIIYTTYYSSTHKPRRSQTIRLLELIQCDHDLWRWSTSSRSSLRRSHQPRTHEGQLLRVQRVACVVRFSFLVTAWVTPKLPSESDPQVQHWVIWQDQVDADQWRRLVVLSRFWSSG